MYNNCKKNRSAFTLVEILVAVSIFAIIITVVYTTLYTGLKAYHRTQSELRLNQEVDRLLERLSIELRNCYDSEYVQEEEKLGFLADAKSMSFFTIHNSYSENEFRKLLTRVTYVFRNGRLFKKLQVDKNAFLDESQFQEEELISDIKDFNFKYLYAQSLEENPEFEWRSEWKYKEYIPVGVKVEMSRYDLKSGINLNLERYIFLIQGVVTGYEESE